MRDDDAPPMSAETSRFLDAAARVSSERGRQMSKEGWTAEHDDEHADGSLLTVAVIYLHADPDDPSSVPMNGDVPMGWPWHPSWWKPKDRVRNLERSGALALAEYDRCSRANLPTDPARHKYRLAVTKLAEILPAAGG